MLKTLKKTLVSINYLDSNRKNLSYLLKKKSVIEICGFEWEPLQVPSQLSNNNKANERGRVLTPL